MRQRIWPQVSAQGCPSAGSRRKKRVAVFIASPWLVGPGGRDRGPAPGRGFREGTTSGHRTRWRAERNHDAEARSADANPPPSGGGTKAATFLPVAAVVELAVELHYPLSGLYP